MKTETVEEFLARGGKIQKSKSEISLDQLLFNEGLLDKDDADQVKSKLGEKLSSGLYEASKQEEKK